MSTTDWPDKGKLDPETNLPVLPDGYFWRVHNYAQEWGFWGSYIEIMKSRTRRSWNPFRQKPVDTSYSVFQMKLPDNFNAVMVRGKADDAVKDWVAQQERVTLYGTYPPKKMEE